MNKQITVNFQSMCRSNILGEGVTLPTSPELEQAILVINKACSDEVKRREEYFIEEFLLSKAKEIDYNQGCRHTFRKILREIYDQGKKGVL